MRSVRVLLLTALSLLIMTSAVFGAAPRDIQLHWSGTAINTLLELGILDAPQGDRFKPDRDITRAEAADFFAQYVRVKGLQPMVQGTEMGGIAMTPAAFTDVTDERLAEDLQLLAGMGILSGYPDGTFRPKEPLTREAMVSMIAALASKENTGSEILSPPDFLPDKPLFTDVAGSYAKEAIVGMASAGIVKGYPDGTFQPNRRVTRGEAASMLFQLGDFSASAPAVTLPLSNVINVPYISQIEPYRAWVGCEATSLLMGLKGKGYAKDINLQQFLDGMPKDPSNPAKGFAGSPYKPDKEKKVRTTIYPPKLVEYASAYGKVSDFSGSSPEEIQAELLAGNPVVVYVTMRWEVPYYRDYNIEGTYQRLVSNNHAVLVCGYNSEKRQYYISDPYNLSDWDEEYRYWIDAGLFDSRYNERRHAVVVESAS